MKRQIIIMLALLALTITLFANPADRPMKGNCPNDMNNEMMPQHQGMGHGDMMQGPGMKDMMEQLKLTDAQKDQIKDLTKNHIKFMNTKQAELKNLMIDKMAAMKSEDYTTAKSLNKSITDAQLAIANAQVDNHANMMKVLTADQKTAFQKMMADRKPMMKNKMHKEKRGSGFWGKHKGNQDKEQCEECNKD